MHTSPTGGETPPHAVTIASEAFAGMDPDARVQFELAVAELLGGTAAFRWRQEPEAPAEPVPLEKEQVIAARARLLETVSMRGGDRQLVTTGSITHYAHEELGVKRHGGLGGHMQEFTAGLAAFIMPTTVRNPRLRDAREYPKAVMPGLICLSILATSSASARSGSGWKRSWGFAPQAFVGAVDLLEATDLKARIAGYGPKVRDIVRQYTEELRPYAYQRLD